MRTWHGVALAGLFVLGSCSSNGSPAVLQELDATVGDAPVHVTYDNASRVCSTVRSGTPVCQSIDVHRSEGIQTAQLDPAEGPPYVLRLLIQSGTTLDGLPGDVLRMSVGLDTDLVVALYDHAPACFHQTDLDGQTHTVSVAASQVDSGSGVTAVASTESPC